MIKGDKQGEEGVCLCVQPVAISTVAPGLRELQIFFASILLARYSLAFGTGTVSAAPLARSSQRCSSCLRINQHPNHMANAINRVRHCAAIKPY